MHSTPFILLNRGEKLSTIPTNLEVTLSFLASEYFRRKMGGEYEYLTRAMIPFIKVQISPPNVLLLEGFTEKVDQLKIPKGPNTARLGNILRQGGIEDFSANLKKCIPILEQTDTTLETIQGVVAQEAANGLLPFFQRASDKGFALFVADVPSQIDQAKALNRSKALLEAITTVKNSIEQHNQAKDFIKTAADPYLTQLITQINKLNTRLDREMQSTQSDVKENITQLKKKRKDLLYEKDQWLENESRNAIKLLLPSLSTLQNLTTEFHDRLEVLRLRIAGGDTKADELYKQSIDFLDKIFNEIGKIRSAAIAIDPKFGDVKEKILELQKEASEKTKRIEENYRSEVDVQNQRVPTIKAERSKELEELKSVRSGIEVGLDEVYNKSSELVAKLEDLHKQLLEYTVPSATFKVTKTVDIVNIPFYIGKLNKNNISSYFVLPPSTFNPQRNRQIAGVPVMNPLDTQLNQHLQERLSKVLQTDKVANERMDKACWKANLFASKKAEEMLSKGLDNLVEMKTLLPNSISSIKRSWAKSLRICPHCKTKVTNRQGFCSTCGKAILS